jgi:uncharacterized membrane protein YidH (DUF202 family)
MKSIDGAGAGTFAGRVRRRARRPSPSAGPDSLARELLKLCALPTTGTVTDQRSAASDDVATTAWREYRSALALLAAGVVLVVTSWIVTASANSTGGYSASFWPGFALYIAPIAGGMLILLAGTVALYHRSFLQQNRHPP